MGVRLIKSYPLAHLLEEGEFLADFKLIEDEEEDEEGDRKGERKKGGNQIVKHKWQPHPVDSLLLISPSSSNRGGRLLSLLNVVTLSQAV